MDDISPLFDNTQVTFPLEIGGVAVDPQKVNSQNIFVSLGGVMQIPVAQAGNPLAGLAYEVGLDPITRAPSITFAVPPLLGTTCNIRVVASDEFLTCPIPDQTTVLKDGPGIIVNEDNQIIGIDPGLLI